MEVIESALHECDMLEQEEKFFVLRDWAEKYYPELYEEWINTKGSEEEKEAWLEIIKVAPAQMRAWRPIWPGEMD